LGFQTITSVLELAKTVHAIDRAATVKDNNKNINNTIIIRIIRILRMTVTTIIIIKIMAGDVKVYFTKQQMSRRCAQKSKKIKLYLCLINYAQVHLT
jgi:hypothetical protein